jgi:glycerophosphoryl diester phosphodiesterase
MRSSRSAPDPLDPGPTGFTHRGLHGPEIPENSLAAFEQSLSIGAGIECDLRLTADGVPIVFHDRDTARLCGDFQVCSEKPWHELRGLSLAGGDQRIPSLDALLDLVAGRVPLLLELKDERHSARFAAATVATLARYDGPVGVMSFSARIGQWLARFAPDTRRGLVLSGRDNVLRRWDKMRRVKPQFLAIKVRTPAERRHASRHADAPIWEANGRP